MKFSTILQDNSKKYWKNYLDKAKPKKILEKYIVTVFFNELENKILIYIFFLNFFQVLFPIQMQTKYG